MQEHFSALEKSSPGGLAMSQYSQSKSSQSAQAVTPQVQHSSPVLTDTDCTVLQDLQAAVVSNDDQAVLQLIPHITPALESLVFADPELCAATERVQPGMMGEGDVQANGLLDDAFDTGSELVDGALEMGG